ncbi:MAG: TolC family protein [Bacteroidota bacterium]
MHRVLDGLWGVGRRRAWGGWMPLALALLAAPSALAQDDRHPDVPCEPGRDCPVLTLDAFLDQVVRTNPAARSLRLESDRARADLLDARGGFDPVLLSGYEYKTEENQDKLNVLRGGVALPFDLPMSPSLVVDYRRGLGSSIDPSVSTSSAGETRFGLSFSPLQGFGTTKRRAALESARFEPRLAEAFETRGQNLLLLEATRTFWSWVEAQEVLQVNRELLVLATERRDFVVRQARAGETAAVDSVEAELAVVSREGKVAEAVRKAEQASVKLSVFLWSEDGAPESSRYTAPALPALPAEPDSAQAVATALAERPELREVALEQRQMEVEQRLAREQLRPDLRLEAQVVSYDDNPLGVTDVKLGFKIDQPLFFRSGRSEVARAEIEMQALRFEQDLAQRAIRADVDAVLVALRQSLVRVSAAERRVELSQRLQEAEQRRFELGESTLFLVNQREQAFAEAREERIAARIDVLQADATFRWATGTIGDRLRASGR